MSRGIILFGVNNSIINYIHLAVIAAGFIKKNMPGTNVSLITDQAGIEFCERDTEFKYSEIFDKIIASPKEDESLNSRQYKNTRYYSVMANFNNGSRRTAYDLSPYDETILLDSDYLICNDVLSKCWDSTEEFMINKSATRLDHRKLNGPEYRLNSLGIRMYWATSIYFKKCEKSKQIFDLVNFIRENWDYYQLVYDFPGNLFRNDYAFSIAIHILGGRTETSDIVCSLPDNDILTALDIDAFYKIIDSKTLLFFFNNREEHDRFHLSKVNSLNVHCMNKISILENMTDIREHLDV